MGKFKEFLNEEKEIHKKEIPFEHNPHLGWWDDPHKDHVTVYHGTHKKNIKSVYEHGLNHKDPHTGMISLALEPHTAHGYAAMSGAGGEHHFRSHGGKPVHTEHKDRVVFKLKVPKDWIHKHKDPNFSGNIGNARKHLTDPEEYKRQSSHPEHADHHYYSMSELRVKEHVPKEFIVGHMHKVKE